MGFGWEKSITRKICANTYIQQVAARFRIVQKGHCVERGGVGGGRRFLYLSCVSPCTPGPGAVTVRGGSPVPFAPCTGWPTPDTVNTVQFQLENIRGFPLSFKWGRGDLSVCSSHRTILQTHTHIHINTLIGFFIACLSFHFPFGQLWLVFFFSLTLGCWAMRNYRKENQQPNETIFSTFRRNHSRAPKTRTNQSPKPKTSLRKHAEDMRFSSRDLRNGLWLIPSVLCHLICQTDAFRFVLIELYSMCVYVSLCVPVYVPIELAQ